MPTIGVKIRVFVPKEVYNLASVQREIQHTMIQKTIPDIRREFMKTHSTWDHSPNWSTDQYFGVRVMWVKVYTYSTQYRLVNAGARPHMITARRKPILRFQRDFRAKSRPRLIKSFVGGKYGPYWNAKSVMHPGHEAREFDKTIAEEYQETFREDIQEAIKTGIVHG